MGMLQKYGEKISVIYFRSTLHFYS